VENDQPIDENQPPEEKAPAAQSFRKEPNNASEEWKKIRPEKLFVVFGFALMAISVFLPWLSAHSTAIIPLSITKTGMNFRQKQVTAHFSFLFQGL
jgi:hypothetical protein